MIKSYWFEAGCTLSPTFVLSWLSPFIWLSIELRSESTDVEAVTAAEGVFEALSAPVPAVCAADGDWPFISVGVVPFDGFAASHQIIPMTTIMIITVTIVFPVFDMYFDCYPDKTDKNVSLYHSIWSFCG